MRSWLRALPLALCLIAPGLGWAQDDDPPTPKWKQVFSEYLEQLEQNAAKAPLGELDVEVILVDDYFYYAAAKEVLGMEDLASREPEDLKAALKRLTKRKDVKKGAGKPALIVRVEHKKMSKRNFYAFKGGLDDHVVLRDLDRIKLKALHLSGAKPEAKRMQLFSPHLSEAWRAGSYRDMLTVKLGLLPGGECEMALQIGKISKRAEKLTAVIGGFILMSGKVNRDAGQVDFNGATGVTGPTGKLPLELPGEVPTPPQALLDVMPVWPSD